MSKADEMFEKLGYLIDIGGSYGLIRYVMEGKHFTRYIRFLLKDKKISTNAIIDNGINSLDLSIQELKAINKKVEELGWN